MALNFSLLIEAKKNLANLCALLFCTALHSRNFYLPTFFPVNVLRCAEKKHTQNKRKFIVRAQAPNPCFLRYLLKKKFLATAKHTFDRAFAFGYSYMNGFLPTLLILLLNGPSLVLYNPQL